MDWLTVHDWDDWQSYRKDRGQPPWIKVHRTLLRDVKWVSLGCHDRGILVSLWLLAADHNGRIPADPAILKKLCFFDEEPDINKFIELGLLDGERRQRDANVTPTRRQRDEPEVEVEVEVETEKKNTIALPPKRSSKTTTPKITLAERPPDVTEQTWDDFQALRQKKKAPLTPTALSGILKQAESIGWSLEEALQESCARGWQGFRAEWIEESARGGNGTGKPFDAEASFKQMAEEHPFGKALYEERQRRKAGEIIKEVDP